MARGKHPNSQKNLNKFKEGESGDPAGKQKSFHSIKNSNI